MKTRLIVVALCLGCIPTTALAQASATSSDPFRRSSVTGAIPNSTGWFQAPDWQAQYDAAKARKSSGKSKMLIGAVVAGAGIATIFIGSNNCVDDILSGGDCDGGRTVQNLGYLADLAGVGIFSWGVYQYTDANNDMRGLEAQRATSKTNGSAIAVGENQAIRFSVGKTTSLGYSVRW